MKHLVFDLHGVLLGRSEPAGRLCAAEVITRLRRRGRSVYFLTNSSSVSPVALAGRLAHAGIEAHKTEVFTAAMAVSEYLCSSGREHRVHVLGSVNLRECLSRCCPQRVRLVPPDTADTVVVSRTRRLDRALLCRLATPPRKQLIATCRDTSFPSAEGKHVGPGETVRQVELALGQEAHVVGKPNPKLLTSLLGIPASEIASTLVVGDSMEQDVQLARNAGATAALLVHEPNQGTEQRGSTWLDLFPIATLDELLEGDLA